MATPNYFKNYNTIQYAVSADKSGRIDYMDIVDYFHLSVVREDIYVEDTLYVPYTVKNGETPDQVSFEQYGNEEFYWIVLQINGITDYYNEWPLSQVELDEYILKKYGSDSKSGEVRFYETVETYDSEDNLVLPSGLVVSEDFVYEYPTSPQDTVYLTSLPVGVTNREYEYRLNEEKSEIQILDPKYVFEYNREVKKKAKAAKGQKSEINISELI